MRYYAVKIFKQTDESRAYYKLHDNEYDPECPLDILVISQARINIEKIVCYFPHSDKRATIIYMEGNENLTLPIPFELFDSMVMNGDYLETEQNKIAK